MHIWIFSDLHIRSKDDPISERVARTLASIPSGDRVVFAGDIVDVFGGRTYFFKRYSFVLDWIRELLERGVAVDWIEGNHDFHLEPELSRVLPGIKTHVLELRLGPLFVAHGDAFNSADVRYQKWRARVRSPAVRWLLKRLPASWLHRLGERSSRWSRSESRTSSHLEQWNDRMRQAVEALRLFARQKFDEGFSSVVLGHIHVEDQIDTTQSQYMNIGFPPVHGTIVVWDSADMKLSRVGLTA